jgi:hypothetical protein
MTLHKITEFYEDCFSVLPNITSKFLTIATFKSFVKKMIKIKLICMSVTFYCAKLHFSCKCNGSWVVSIKLNTNFNYKLPSSFRMFVFPQNALLQRVYPLKIYQHATFHGPTLACASFAFTSEVRTSAILKRLKERDWKLWLRDHIQWNDLPVELNKNLLTGSKVTGENRRTDRIVIS